MFVVVYILRNVIRISMSARVCSVFDLQFLISKHKDLEAWREVMRRGDPDLVDW